MYRFLVSSTLLVLFLFATHPCRASVDLGVGVNSATSGRPIPAIAAGISGSNWALSGASTGVQTAYYFHSSYTLQLFRTWKSGEFFWGSVESGFGIGAMHAKRGYQDEGQAQMTLVDDYGFGPAFKVQWYFAGPAFLRLETLLGLRNVFRHVALTAQDVTTLSIGVQAW